MAEYKFYKLLVLDIKSHSIYMRIFLPFSNYFTIGLDVFLSTIHILPNPDLFLFLCSRISRIHFRLNRNIPNQSQINCYTKYNENGLNKEKHKPPCKIILFFIFFYFLFIFESNAILIQPKKLFYN